MLASISAPNDDKYRMRARAVVELRIAAPQGYPLFGWSPDAVMIEFAERPLAAGDAVILYNAQSGLHRYQLARVVNPCGPMNRIEVDRTGAAGGTKFHRSGISASAPKGGTQLLPAVPALMQHLADGCDVVLDLKPYSMPATTRADAQLTARSSGPMES